MSTDFYKMHLSNFFLWLMAWGNDIVEMGNCTRWYVCYEKTKLLFGIRIELKLWDIIKNLPVSLNKCVFFGEYSLLFIFMRSLAII